MNAVDKRKVIPYLGQLRRWEFGDQPHSFLVGLYRKRSPSIVPKDNAATSCALGTFGKWQFPPLQD